MCCYLIFKISQSSREQAVNQACMLVYTSGTTGNPKGAMISQDNLTWTVEVKIINTTVTMKKDGDWDDNTDNTDDDF